MIGLTGPSPPYQFPFIAAYAIAVRTSEYDLPPDILEDIVGRMVSGFSGADSYGGRKGSRADDNDDDEVYD